MLFKQQTVKMLVVKILNFTLFIGVKKMAKQKQEDAPGFVVVLYDYDPINNEVPSDKNCQSPPPNPSVQLSISRGEKLEVLNKTLDWWLMCKSPVTYKEGYVFSSLTAPFRDPSESR
jgi:hypothetical protein